MVYCKTSLSLLEKKMKQHEMTFFENWSFLDYNAKYKLYVSLLYYIVWILYYKHIV